MTNNNIQSPWKPANPDQIEGRLHRTNNKSIFSKLGKFFLKLWQIFRALLVAPWQLDYKSDNFEEIFSFGPFILWYDIVSEWILLFHLLNSYSKIESVLVLKRAVGRCNLAWGNSLS